MVAIRDAEVSQNDVDRVIETATAINIPSDQQILHVLPQEFIIDGQEDIKEPIGMSGRRLEVRAHIVTGAVSAAQNIVKCIKRCGIGVNDLVLQPLASSSSILTEDEKNLGTLLIDIGGGTTDIAIFSGGSIRHTAVIPIAGDQITSDIAMALRTSTNEAETIKLTHGVCKQSLVKIRSEFEVAGLGDRPTRSLSKNALAAVIEPRVEELFSLVSQVTRESGFDELISSGVVLTGGSSLLFGMVELAEDVFFRQVRVANPEYSGNLADVISNPRYSTAMGLIIEANKDLLKIEQDILQSNSWFEIVKKMKSWFVGNF
jgi:cell division protein FtsA